MRVITTARGFSDALEGERALGRRIGLVPTMGALHAGHRSLVARAAADCDTVAVTVFVNPLQFNVAEDLANYPRDLEGDVDQAAASGAAIVFAPPVQEMYPGFPAPVATSVHVDVVGDLLEGASRPGHFDGVATVVAKLCSLAGRSRVYFGDKDFQQLAVVRRMVADLSLPVEIVSCPTVREADGLALSSRNVRLSGEGRRAAVALPRALDAGLAALGAGERDPVRVGAAMRDVLEAASGVDPDYAAAVDAATLATPARLGGEIRLLVAATVGPVRLIDNVGMTLEPADAVEAAPSASATPVGVT
ncbi:MAG TPA: pantoate--beta-alanine ligase [Acidimicrobiales bacterium]|nr:pantoate--beta-alanine ligase [Acidimicrobiales bacterium]